MGLKGYRLWVMGQLDSNVQSPTSSALNTCTLVAPPLLLCSFSMALKICHSFTLGSCTRCSAAGCIWKGKL
jgi:hypothetical protein